MGKKCMYSRARHGSTGIQLTNFSTVPSHLRVGPTCVSLASYSIELKFELSCEFHMSTCRLFGFASHLTNLI